MKMNKIILPLLSVATILILFTGCTKQDSNPPKNDTTIDQSQGEQDNNSSKKHMDDKLANIFFEIASVIKTKPIENVSDFIISKDKENIKVTEGFLEETAKIPYKKFMSSDGNTSILLTYSDIGVDEKTDSSKDDASNEPYTVKLESTNDSFKVSASNEYGPAYEVMKKYTDISNINIDKSMKNGTDLENKFFEIIKLLSKDENTSISKIEEAIGHKFTEEEMVAVETEDPLLGKLSAFVDLKISDEGNSTSLNIIMENGKVYEVRYGVPSVEDESVSPTRYLYTNYEILGSGYRKIEDPLLNSKGLVLTKQFNDYKAFTDTIKQLY